MKTRRISQFDAERQFLEVTHQDIGSLAAHRWQLPPAYLSPIARHHNPDEGGADMDRLTAYVHVSNVMAHEIGLGFDKAQTPPCADPAALALLNISEEQYEPIRLAVAHEVQKLGSLLGV